MGKSKISQEINEDVERMPTTRNKREGKAYGHSKTSTISNDEDDSPTILTRNQSVVQEKSVVMQFQVPSGYQNAEMTEEELQRRLEGPLNPVIIFFKIFAVIITIILIVQKGMKWLCCAP